MAKQVAIRFRRKVYVASPRHQDAINVAFAGMTQHQIRRVYDRVADGKEEIVFGFAYNDGSEFEPSESQDARKMMYGFD